MRASTEPGTIVWDLGPADLAIDQLLMAELEAQAEAKAHPTCPTCGSETLKKADGLRICVFIKCDALGEEIVA